MPNARYFLPDRPTLQEVYSKDELRALLKKGELRRGDIVMDDETGLAHLLGDLLSRPQSLAHDPVPDEKTEAQPEPDEAEAEDDDYEEFRADTPMPVTELEAYSEDEEDFMEDESDEELVLHLRPSWFSYPKSVFLAVLCAAGAYYCFVENLGLLYFLAAISASALCLLGISLVRSTTDYYITTARVETESGLIARNSNEVRICDIRAIDVRMTGLSGLIGVGTVDFCSAGGATVDVQFKNIHKPHYVKRVVRALQEN